MAIEQDTTPQPNTFRYWVRAAVAGLSYLRAYWGRRMVGGAIGLYADMMAEGATQSFYARLPGHSQQAADSLRQVGLDRDLSPFRGESQAAFAARVKEAWADYAQGGTKQQMLRVLNQWGSAAWPDFWVDLTDSNFVESAHTSFTFTITIPFGSINPPWTPWHVGDPVHVGDPDLYVGIGPSDDLPMLLYLVKKWKPARSKGFVNVYYDVTHYITFIVGSGGY